MLAGHPDVDLVGFWGRDETKARDVAARVGGRGFARLDDLLESVDAVAIALPPAVQAPLAARAARAGKHLLLDKPLALDVPAADAVVAAAAASGVSTVTFVTLMYQPEVQSWLDQMALLAAEHGPWEGVTVRCLSTIDQPGSPYAQSSWRWEKGGLWDLGPHALSVVGELLPPVRRVRAAVGVRDTVNVLLEHDGGPGSVLTLSLTVPEVAQESSVVVWGPGGRHQLDLSGDTPREAYRNAVDHLRGAVRSRKPHAYDAAYSRGVVAVLAAAERDLGG